MMMTSLILITLPLFYIKKINKDTLLFFSSVSTYIIVLYYVMLFHHRYYIIFYTFTYFCWHLALIVQCSPLFPSHPPIMIKMVDQIRRAMKWRHHATMHSFPSFVPKSTDAGAISTFHHQAQDMSFQFPIWNLHSGTEQEKYLSCWGKHVACG